MPKGKKKKSKKKDEINKALVVLGGDQHPVDRVEVHSTEVISHPTLGGPRGGSRRARQEEFKGMPASELTQACNAFIEAEDAVHEKKKVLDIAAGYIIKILGQEKRSSVIVDCNDNRAYRFYTDHGKVRLKKTEVRSPSDKTHKGRGEA